jgi:hypothetical protein
MCQAVKMTIIAKDCEANDTLNVDAMKNGRTHANSEIPKVQYRRAHREWSPHKKNVMLKIWVR